MINDQNTIITYRQVQFREIPIEQLEPGVYQPRQAFTKDGLESLAQTIRQIGILEPLAIRPLIGQSNRFEIIAGERRWRAAQLVGLSTVPCLLAYYSDEEAAQAALIENTCREDLTPIVKANAMQRLIHEFGYTHERLGEILGMNRTSVTNLLRLLKLDARIQVWLGLGELSEGHGKVLAGLPLDDQYALAYRAIQHNWSVRALEKVAADNTAQKKKMPLRVPPPMQALELEQQLLDQLGYSIKVVLQENQAGHFRIDFDDMTQMQTILEKLGYKKFDP